MDIGTTYLHINGIKAEKFHEFSPGEILVLKVICRLDSMGREEASLEVTEFDIIGEADSYDDAVRRAKNEVYVTNRVEPSVG